MNESFQERGSPGYAGAAASALKSFRPDCGRDFILPPSFIPTGSRFTNPAVPLPCHGLFFLQAMVGLALSCGARRSSGVLLQFLFFLRTSEIHGLRLRDVSWLNSGHVVVDLPHTKASRGRALCFSLEPFCAGCSLPSCHRGSSAPIIDSSLQVFRARFQKLVVFLDLEDGAFLPCGLRRGGATFHWGEEG